MEWMDRLSQWLENEPGPENSSFEIARDWSQLYKQVQNGSFETTAAFFEKVSAFFEFSFLIEKSRSEFRVGRGFHLGNAHIFSPAVRTLRDLELEPSRVLRLPADRIFSYFGIKPSRDFAKFDGFLFSLSDREAFVGLTSLADPWLPEHIEKCLDICHEFRYVRREQEEERRLRRFQSQLKK